MTYQLATLQQVQQQQPHTCATGIYSHVDGVQCSMCMPCQVDGPYSLRNMIVLMTPNSSLEKLLASIASIAVL